MSNVRRPTGRQLLRLLPLLDLLLVVVADLSLRRVVLLGLLSTVPLLAASVCAPRTTARYGAAAVGFAAGLGVLDRVYVPGPDLAAQLIRLSVIAVMSGLGYLVSRDRVRREAKLAAVTAVADVAQRAILIPVPERLGPARVAVHYESAAEDALVGGDLYGLVTTRHGVRILVGDARGKGLGAVRLSAQVLATFRERANDDADLWRLLAHLDRAVERAAESEEDFVTAVLAQLDDDGCLTVMDAGHPPPLVLTAGRVRTLDVDDPVGVLGLGLVGPDLVAGRTVRLATGDRLLLHTDGLTEARDRTGAFFPAATAAGRLASARDVRECVDGVVADVVAWSGGVLHDDLAVVAVEYLPDRGADPDQDQDRD